MAPPFLAFAGLPCSATGVLAVAATACLLAPAWLTLFGSNVRVTGHYFLASVFFVGLAGPLFGLVGVLASSGAGWCRRRRSAGYWLCWLSLGIGAALILALVATGLGWIHPTCHRER